MLHSLSMQHKPTHAAQAAAVPPAVHYIPSSAPSSGMHLAPGPGPGAMMALVCCVALLHAATVVEAASSAVHGTSAASSSKDGHWSAMMEDFKTFPNNCPGAWWKAAPSIWLYFAGPFLHFADAPPAGRMDEQFFNASLIGMVYVVTAVLVCLLSVCCVGVQKTCSAAASLLFFYIPVASIAWGLCMWPTFAYASWLQHTHPTWCYGFLSFTISGTVCGVAPLIVAAGMLFVIAKVKEHDQNEKRKGIKAR